MSYFKRYGLFLCFIPVLSLSYVIHKYLINLPTGDDIFTMEMFNLLHHATGFWEKIIILFSQHNEHRILVTRLVAVLQYGLSDSVDLRWWIIAGNLSLPFLVWIFYLNLKQTPWLTIPIAFILLAPISNTFAAMQNANLFSVLFCVAAFHFSLKKPYHLSSTVYVFLFIFLAIFSNGGGFIGFGLVSLVFFFQARYRLLIYWSLFGILVLTGYFWDYQKIYRHPNSEALFQHIPQAISFLSVFLGSISLKTWLATITGCVFLGLFAWLFFEKYYQRRPFIFLCFAYGILMGVLTSLTRYEHGVGVALAERYAIYSMLLAAAAIPAVYDIFSKFKPFHHYVFAGILVWSMALNFKYVSLKLHEVDKTHTQLLTAMENYHLNHSGYTCMEVNILDRLARNGLYSFPINRPVHPKSFYDSINALPIHRIKLRVDSAYTTSQNLHFYLTILDPQDAPKKLRTILLKYLVIHNDATPFDCHTNVFTSPHNDQTMIVDISLENKKRNVSLPQLAIVLPKKHFEKGDYTLYFLFFLNNPVNYPSIKTNVSFRLLG